MSSRDLLQQRATDPNGDTRWTQTPLVAAALEGSLAVLDGLHRVDPGTLSVLQRLAQDRETTLNDGTRLVGHDRYDKIAESNVRMCSLRTLPVMSGGARASSKSSLECATPICCLLSRF